MSQVQISIEELAVRFGTTVWSKGDKKRIYLDRGYNTKKMSTKTYVYQNEDGSYDVACYIECPSQPYEWIKSQQQEVIEGVKDDLNDMLSDTAYILTNEAEEFVDYKGVVVDLFQAEGFYTEAKANERIKSCAAYSKFITMPRDQYDAEVERIRIEGKPERDRIAAIEEEKRTAERTQVLAKKEAESKKLQATGEIIAVSTRVKHGRFGIGTVTASASDAIEVLFDDSEFGLKKMARQFVKLEILPND